MPCKSLPLVTQCHVIGSSNCEAIWKWSLIMMFQEKTERRTNFGKWGYLWIAYSKVAAFMLDHNVSPSMSRWSHLQEPGNCEMEWNCAGLWGAPRFKGSRFSGAGFRGIFFFFLPTMVLKHLSETLTAGTKVFCDRFFTTTQAVNHMLKNGVYLPGTVMKNWVPQALKKLPDDNPWSSKEGVPQPQ